MADFKETYIIMHELEQLFNRDDDIKDILDIRKMQTEIETQCAAHLKDTKEVIKGYTMSHVEFLILTLSLIYCPLCIFLV